MLVFKVWGVFQDEVSVVSGPSGPPGWGRGGQTRRTVTRVLGLHGQRRAAPMLRGDRGASPRRVLRGRRGRGCLRPLV